MKLNDFDTRNSAAKALKANFDFNFDASKLNHASTKNMLTKVKGLVKEAKSRPDFYKNQTSASYLKLVFMEQALSTHLSTLKAPKIVVENEEVEKSQVILAAQDMVDSVQKMVEEVNDMLVKELPALTDSIQSEIGVNESSSFNQSASGALTTLNQCLSDTKKALTDALNQLTGVGGGDMFGAAPAGGGEEVAVTDISATKDVEEPVAPELPAEEPELAPVGGVGRAKR